MTGINIDLSGQGAVVTGAASGIGRATARMLAEAGAGVLCCDMAEAVEAVADEIREAGGRAEAMRMDAGSEADVAAAVAKAEELFGGLDIFHANAGITGGPGSLFEVSPEIWTEVLRVNLIGPWLAVKHATPAMQKRGGGSIVLTASVAGMRANAGPAQYSASKAGVINLAQTASYQLAGTGVRVNAICPGLIETGMTRPIYDYAKATGTALRIGSMTPMKRGGEPEEIASTVLWLSSPLASYVNGQAIPVCGGLSASHPYGPRPDREKMEQAIAEMKARDATG
ncbi:SDR family NAD(P)-dependent oxidoreductase [Oceanicola sp. 22II-s10i]|uniref:SDR family NAD(P)-dependent oxidoreductase n=1 Tax=Oceanicola sp. 22II-s10i TaxID=1317116 RepID=UPI000B520A9B|nr:SDR family NAD(P)-dependent oxidoreductase [Oceanicola sp. 22II-s10i]